MRPLISRADLAGRRVGVWGPAGVEGQASLRKLAARRPDRAGPGLLQTLAAELAGYPAPPDPAVLLAPIGAHFIPERYAPADLLG